MFIPKYFEINNLADMVEVIHAHGFATVYSTHQDNPYATHLPLLLNHDGTELVGHFAKGNKQWIDIEGQQVLVVFQGPHCYISPSWYETKDAVPTWNYATVHIEGKVKLMEEGDSRLWESMVNLTEKYEEPSSNYSLEEVEASYIEGLSKGVVGFTISIEKMEGKAKLSQNHTKDRVERVVEALEKTGKSEEQQIARLMKMKSNIPM